MSLLLTDIVWEGDTPLPTEYQLENVKCYQDIDGHLLDTFGEHPVTYTVYEL